MNGKGCVVGAPHNRAVCKLGLCVRGEDPLSTVTVRGITAMQGVDAGTGYMFQPKNGWNTQYVQKVNLSF